MVSIPSWQRSQRSQRSHVEHISVFLSDAPKRRGAQENSPLWSPLSTGLIEGVTVGENDKHERCDWSGTVTRPTTLRSRNKPTNEQTHVITVPPHVCKNTIYWHGAIFPVVTALPRRRSSSTHRTVIRQLVIAHVSLSPLVEVSSTSFLQFWPFKLLGLRHVVFVIVLLRVTIHYLGSVSLCRAVCRLAFADVHRNRFLTGHNGRVGSRGGECKPGWSTLSTKCVCFSAISIAWPVM